jgi:hypothetical protein
MKKKSDYPFKPKKLTNREIQLSLIENFVGLQRVLTNLTLKFDTLSDNINKLLNLYEIAARSFIKKVEDGSLSGEDKDILKKLDTMLDQNKTVAKSLTLIEEKIRHKIYGDHIPSDNTSTNFKPITIPEERIGEKPRPRPFPKI